MTTYLNLGFTCYAPREHWLSHGGFLGSAEEWPSLQGACCFCLICRGFIPVTLWLGFITGKEPLATCYESLQRATSSLNSSFLLNFSTSGREPGLGQILGELPPSVENPALASTPTGLPSSLPLEQTSASRAMFPLTFVVPTFSIPHRTLGVDSQKGPVVFPPRPARSI